MPQFRKKPITIHAWEVPVQPPSTDDCPSWIVDAFLDGTLVAAGLQFPRFIEIKTLEGTMTAQPGDWIIRGIKGDLYPCKPDIFEATYEPC